MKYLKPVLQNFNQIIFLIFLSIGFIFIFFSINSSIKINQLNFFNGEMTAEIESEISTKNPLRKVAVDIWGAFEFSVFRIGYSGVLVGKNNWLFSSEEFTYHKEFMKNIQEKIEKIKSIKRKLNSKKIDLMVVIVPSKARLYSEFLGDYKRPLEWEKVHGDFLESLRRENIQVISVLAAMRSAKPKGDLFFRTDTHWTPLGSRVAAQVISKSNFLETIKTQTTQYIWVSQEKESYSGDLLKFIPVRFLGGLAPKPDTLNLSKLENSTSSSLNLLEESAPEIALVGTSYSANPKFGFLDALKFELQADIVNLSEVGKGFISPMEKFLTSTNQKGIKLVIWEIPERYLPIR